MTFQNGFSLISALTPARSLYGGVEAAERVFAVLTFNLQGLVEVVTNVGYAASWTSCLVLVPSAGSVGGGHGGACCSIRYTKKDILGDD